MARCTRLEYPAAIMEILEVLRCHAVRSPTERGLTLKLILQVFHTALEVVCDGLHVLIEDPYGPRIGVQYRLPQSNEYHQVLHLELQVANRPSMGALIWVQCHT